MTDRLSEQASSIGALAEPVRRALYRYVVGQREPVSREQAAEGVGVPVHTAKFHLDKLVDEGLLDVEFRRLTGRTGPGAGRPSKLYRRSSRELSVSLPERRYDVVGRILAGGVVRAGAEDVPVEEALAQVATEEGRRVAGAATADRRGHRAGGRGAPSTTATSRAGATTRCCSPTARSTRWSRDHTELVCGLNESFVHGVVDGLGCTEPGRAWLDPEAGSAASRSAPSRRDGRLRPGASRPRRRTGSGTTTLEQAVDDRRHPVEAGPAHGRQHRLVVGLGQAEQRPVAARRPLARRARAASGCRCRVPWWASSTRRPTSSVGA